MDGSDFVVAARATDCLGPAVATLGVFDGVHRGHQALLSEVAGRARGEGVLGLVIGFDPHPVEVLAPELSPQRISAPAVQTRRLLATGLDHAWYLPFSTTMAALHPQEFVELICRRVRLEELWVGYDFRFGKDRKGDRAFLERAGAAAGFSVRGFGPVHQGERALSSTWIREALRLGEVEEAAELLGSPFELEGEVVHGLGLGARELVATANLRPHPQQLLPAHGIYAGWALSSRIPGPVPAAISIGLRPTLGRELGVAVEAHLIDWEGDLYGDSLRLFFARRLREERQYDGLDELRRAISVDVAQARVVFAQSRPAPRPGEGVEPTI